MQIWYLVQMSNATKVTTGAETNGGGKITTGLQEFLQTCIAMVLITLFYK